MVHCMGVVRAIEVFNSDNGEYGGSDKHSYSPFVIKPYNDRPSNGIIIALAPLATMIFRLEYT